MLSRPSSLLLWLIALIAMNALMNAKSARAADKPSVYRHVVFFKFKDTATADQIKRIEDEFRKLPARIGVITGFEWGTNVSPENLNDGFTHCFLVSFKDKEGVDAYLPHPAHQEFVKLLKPHLDKVCVLDYVAKQ